MRAPGIAQLSATPHRAHIARIESERLAVIGNSAIMLALGHVEIAPLQQGSDIGRSSTTLVYTQAKILYLVTVRAMGDLILVL